MGHQGKKRPTEAYGKQEITQPLKCCACCSQEHQIKDYNTDKNIFVRYSRNVHEQQNVMAEYGNIKGINVIHHQN